MQVEAYKDEDSGEPGMSGHGTSAQGWSPGEVGQRAGDYECCQGADQREAEAMQRVMVLREPQQRMRRVPGEKLGNNAQAVKVRRHSCRYDERDRKSTRLNSS